MTTLLKEHEGKLNTTAQDHSRLSESLSQIAQKLKLVQTPTSLDNDTVDKLQREIDWIRRFVVMQSTKRFESAVLDPASKNYTCIDVDQGKLFVSCLDAEPYLDGVRIKLQIGNPMAVDFKGYEIVIRWGERFDDFGNLDRYAAWRASLKERKFLETATLKLAAWNDCTLILPNTKPDDLGYLEASIKLSTVSLSRNIKADN